MYKIMIIEDEPLIQELLRTTLSNDPRYQIIQATDGKLGLEMALAEKPAIILLDVDLPAVNGLEICRRVKKTFGTETKVIMVTAMGQRDQIEAGYAAGADNYYVKPFSPLNLLQRIDEILGVQ